MTRGAMTRLVVPPALDAAIRRHARDAAPRECCGLLEGRRADGAIIVEALHRARNMAAQADRFEMNPADQFAARKAARANGRAIIGCYHSHPGGALRPSAADLAGAGEDGLVWLIANAELVKGFVYLDGGFTGLPVSAEGVK